MINNLDINDFLDNYWQKKPLLIRSAFPDFKSPITSEELAGLACEEFIESRIITEHKNTPKWSLENGPIPESRFSTLPESHWTLLIQGLNKIFPEFDDLLHEFNFIPSWRVDDLMASYAAPQGSVGPHIDQYDVFLLQATGQRKWMISEAPIDEYTFEENIPLKIIQNFKTQSEWVLEAGDMLYLPPNVAHYGIGLENCMTFSIGFRAPSHAELLSAYIDDKMSSLKDELRYTDPKLTAAQAPGEISHEAIKNVQELLLSHFSDTSKIQHWFGQFITDYLNDEQELSQNNISPTEFLTLIENAESIRRPATVRANYMYDANTFALYINGEKFETPPNMNELAMLYCNQHSYQYSDIKVYINNNATMFLCELYNKGYIEFHQECDE